MSNKPARRLAIIAVLAVAGLLIIINPPFVVRPLPGRAPITSAQNPGAPAQPTLTKAGALVEPIWESQLLPMVLATQNDIITVMDAIKADREAAGQKYGKRSATNPYSYIVKGEGKVVSVDTQSRQGSMVVDLQPFDGSRQVTIQIGPATRGSAMREATGLISNDKVTNQLEWEDVAKEMNRRALETALKGIDPTALVGKSIAFYGVFTYDPRDPNFRRTPYLIVPVKIEVVE